MTTDYDFEYDYFDDEEDDENYPYGPNGDDEVWDFETSCVVCGHPNCTDNCAWCGMPLCHMHAELGVGFCPSCPNSNYHPNDVPVSFHQRLHDDIKHLHIKIVCWLHPLPEISEEDIPF